VTREFLNHPLAVKFRLRGMMQNMQTNEALEELLMLHPLGHYYLDLWRGKKLGRRFGMCLSQRRSGLMSPTQISI
jgi:hypothetical protein